MSSRRTTVGRMAAGARRVADPRGLAARLAQLEADVAESKRLNLRVAELTDIVAELLIPLAQNDPARASEILERYRDELGS